MDQSHKSACFVTLVTVGSADEAKKIARTLVEERLIACANIVPAVNSIYRWKGEVCDDDEVLIIMKSTQSRWERMASRIRELHSYEVPEIISLPVTEGSREYLDWVRAEVEST